LRATAHFCQHFLKIASKTIVFTLNYWKTLSDITDWVLTSIIVWFLLTSSICSKVSAVSAKTSKQQFTVGLFTPI
jgi:hypothetical protein